MRSAWFFRFGWIVVTAFSMAPVSAMPLGSTRIANVRFTPPPPPPGDAPAGRARGGASRGDCTQVQLQLTALAPIAITTKQKASVWGFTTEAYPTIWVYVPYTRNLTTPVEFVLQDANGNTHYKAQVALPNQAGVMGIKVPNSVTPLAVGQRYRWFFSVFCDAAKQLPPVSINGEIQRIALNPQLTKQLNNTTLQQQIELYADNGIWYDTLTILAMLRRSNPQDATIAQAWRSLLQSIGQNDMAEATLSN